jgi:hypothetical protein
MTADSVAPTARTDPTVGAASDPSAQAASDPCALMVSAHFDHAPNDHSDRAPIDHSGLVASDRSDPVVIVRRRAVQDRATGSAMIAPAGPTARGAARPPSPDPRTGATLTDLRTDHPIELPTGHPTGHPTGQSIEASSAHSIGRVAVPHRVG